MKIHWRVYVKATEQSPWQFTGIIESNKHTAKLHWSQYIKLINYHAFKLEYCTYGVAIER